MPDALPVHVNRTDIHSLEVPHEFETTGSFDVRIVNHGEALHVHLHLDDALSADATLDATNHYVSAESERLIRIDVTGDGPIRGKLKVVTAYGAQTRYIDIHIPEGGGDQEPVIVDEDLAKPKPKPERQSKPSLAESSRLPVLAVGGVALLLAVLTLVFFTNPLVQFGALFVVAAVMVALYLVLIE